MNPAHPALDPRRHGWLARTLTPRLGSRSCPAAVLLGLLPALLAGRTVSAATLYVWAESPSPTPPYSTWATAARTIQDAVDAAQAGDTILVTNGVYASGGRAVHGTMTNRVAVTKPVTVRSVNGPEVTIIEGRWVPGTTNGDGAIRCVYLAHGAVLSGFTLTKGATRRVGERDREQSGGGVWCESGAAVVTNCVLVGNSAFWYGGGSYYGTLNNCTLSGNSAYYGGGSCYGRLNNCTLSGNRASEGGGSYYGTLNNCTLSGNSATHGGGACGGTLNNCALSGNWATRGGGSYWGTLNNCTLSGNSAQYGGGSYWVTLNSCALSGNSATHGGGSYYGTLHNCTLSGNWAAGLGGGSFEGTLNNCIVYYNTAPTGPNYYGGSLNYCCTTPLPPRGSGNITNEPQLASFSHLSAGSPCRGAGHPAYATGLDIDGEEWLDPPSIGCDEYRPGAVTGDLRVAVGVECTNVAVGVEVPLRALIEGRTVGSWWDFGDGVVVSNRPYISHAWSQPGDYLVVLGAWNESHPGGVTATVRVRVAKQAVHYVWAGSPSPTPPYSTWATAARTIQDAVDAAELAGALVLVTNGVYASGGRAVHGTMANRVAVTKPVTVRSVNGPEVTIIEGGHGVRCVYLTNGAVLSGFTLRKGATRSAGDEHRDQSGGGVWCESEAAVVTNCVVVGNSASRYGGGSYSGTLHNCTLSGNSARDGGGAYGGTLNNCALSGNSARDGGAAYEATLNNCTVIGNSAVDRGGGSYEGTLNNCIVYYNTAPTGPNYYGGSLNYCCTTPLPSTGSGNITNQPQLASFSHLSAGSPCRGAGHPAYATGLDIDGEEWLDPPSIGCDEYRPGAVTGDLRVAVGVVWTNVAVGVEVPLQALIEGRTVGSWWDFGDGVVVSNRPYISHAWSRPGDYLVVLGAWNESHPGGVTATVRVRVVQAVYYVWPESPSPTPPYSTWATAARTIQDAVDVAQAGATVLVTNGVYASGGRAVHGTMTNRVAVTKPVMVRSVNGPEVTIIEGRWVSERGWGDGAIRCVYLTNGAVLSGFTLTKGATRSDGDWAREMSGGGVWCESEAAVVTNCVVVGNSASWSGGGSYSGTLHNCTLTGNSAFGSGGGSHGATLNNCTVSGNSATYGGGSGGGTLHNCTLSGNSAGSHGGGSYSGTLNNCTLIGNSAAHGGGAYEGTLNNCALSGNSAESGGGSYEGMLNNCTVIGNSAVDRGGGSYGGTLANCIVYYNTAPNGPNYYGGSLNYCCTTPLPPSGSGNITNEPQLASFSHLSAGSPCIGAGHRRYVRGVDIDGEEWLDPPSIGCDEYRPGSVTGDLRVAVGVEWTNVAVGFQLPLRELIEGRTVGSWWDFGDGVVVSNRPYTSHAWSQPGNYLVVLGAWNESHPGGVTATVRVRVVPAVHYVWAGSPSPTPPYSTWATAARTIQDAVDAAELAGALVLVTNGVYASGGRAVHGTMTNRVAVTKPLTVRSVNGPKVTIIEGRWVSERGWGDGAIRCVYLTNGAVLSGFTLRKGATRSAGHWARDMNGGGVWCESGAAVVTNCVVVGNSAYSSGGGSYGGTLNHCTLSGNSAGSHGGGAYSGTLNNCTVTSNSAAHGGGSYGGTLNHCTLIGNSASRGGGAYEGTLNHCTLIGNSATWGGGAYEATLNHCAVSGNSAEYGGGAYEGTLNHCTLSGNWALDRGGGSSGATLNHCTLSGNSAYFGGGACEGTLNHCTLSDNSAYQGGGSSGANLINCTLIGNSAHSGGAAYEAALYNCTLSGNSATWGGGAWNALLNNCLVIGNSATWGGGAVWAALYSCTVIANSANYGGGACYGTLASCIVYYNTAPYGPNYYVSRLDYCCTTPLPTGAGNISDEPRFVDTNGWANLRLRFDSPCINAGHNAYAGGPTDLDGNPRILGGRVDMGAYEWQGLRFTPVARPGPGGLELRLWGGMGLVVEIHASSNLVDWVRLVQLTNTTGEVYYIDPLQPLPPVRFYKGVGVP